MKLTPDAQVAQEIKLDRTDLPVLNHRIRKKFA
jgi:hypothetical protein